MSFSCVSSGAQRERFKRETGLVIQSRYLLLRFSVEFKMLHLAEMFETILISTRRKWAFAPVTTKIDTHIDLLFLL